MLPSWGHSNGSLVQGSSEKRHGLSQRECLRRGGRGSRDRGGNGFRVSGQEIPRCTEFDIAYFQSYSHVGIHEEMIKDHVRTDTYSNAIYQHQSSIAGKVVVDVGCGTGILSIFCALAGAKRDVEIDEEVDVIISEWMGYMLLYEHAWECYYSQGSLVEAWRTILPSHATLYMAPVTHPERYNESIDFWRNVYGIDMSAMVPLAKQCAFEEPCVETISGENVLTWPFVVKHVDCYTVTIQELESVTARYKFSSMMNAPLHGFAFRFDVEFSGPAIFPTNNQVQSPQLTSSDVHPSDSQKNKRQKPNEALVVSTAPEEVPTHWQQTLLYFYDPIQ